MNESLAGITRRIEELESQLTFQDQLNDKLNTIVARQDREILVLLNERLKEFGEAIPGGGPQDETPPHY